MGTSYDDWLKNGGAGNKDTGEGFNKWQEKNPGKLPFHQAKLNKKKKKKKKILGGPDSVNAIG
tara:strand:- start:5 stop:193 length:189 start_codon:yes stop_codon:yes gene_type:complete